jgi:hypothetical protein
LNAETDPIRVFQREHEWLVDYGSYAHGYHRRAARLWQQEKPQRAMRVASF